jgi:signal recognition particle receptor subunit beta
MQMARLDYSTHRLTAKIVYYGPGLCGKTTNLQSIHAELPEDVRGKMLAFATKEDRTLIFDFLPVDLGTVRGLDTRIQLYTVPGQVFYNETRKLVLKGTDGIVFVADSQQQLMGANVESLQNLEQNLRDQGASLKEIPHVIQYNKQDLPQLSSVQDMNASLNPYNSPFYTSIATEGTGVLETLRGISRLMLQNLTSKLDNSPREKTETPVIALL